MARPNPQYPRGNKNSKKRDKRQYEEAKERLENEDKKDPHATPSQNREPH
jgi:hypothetical protein